MARKLIDGRVVYLCHNDFGDFDGKPALRKMSPKITDFGQAERGDQPGPRINPIQPDHCHAPEVLLGTGWSYSADTWNFSIMVCHGPLFSAASQISVLILLFLGLGSTCWSTAIPGRQKPLV